LISESVKPNFNDTALAEQMTAPYNVYATVYRLVSWPTRYHLPWESELLPTFDSQPLNNVIIHTRWGRTDLESVGPEAGDVGRKFWLSR